MSLFGAFSKGSFAGAYRRARPAPRIIPRKRMRFRHQLCAIKGRLIGASHTKADQTACRHLSLHACRAPLTECAWGCRYQRGFWKRTRHPGDRRRSPFPPDATEQAYRFLDRYPAPRVQPMHGETRSDPKFIAATRMKPLLAIAFALLSLTPFPSTPRLSLVSVPRFPSARLFAIRL